MIFKIVLTYNVQSFIYTSVPSNSRKWLAYSEAYIRISFVISFQSFTDVTAASAYVQGFAMGLKNGYYQLIDSIQFDNNKKNKKYQKKPNFGNLPNFLW